MLLGVDEGDEHCGDHFGGPARSIQVDIRIAASHPGEGGNAFGGGAERGLIVIELPARAEMG
jgi:hypothetical protein